MIQQKAQSHAIATTWFLDSNGEDFSRALLDTIESRIRDRNLELKPAETFSILTTLPKNSMGLEEEIESLGVVQAIMQDSEANKLFLSLTDFTQIPVVLSPQIAERILAHYEKWCWIPFGYMGPAYDLEYYLTVFAGLVKEKFSTEKRIQEIKTRPAHIVAQQRMLLDTLQLEDKWLQALAIAADSIFLKGYRKDAIF